jgi:hypothetical protein
MATENKHLVTVTRITLSTPPRVPYTILYRVTRESFHGGIQRKDTHTRCLDETKTKTKKMAPSAKSKKSSKATAPKKRATVTKDSVTTTNKVDAKVVGSGASLGDYDVTIGTYVVLLLACLLLGCPLLENPQVMLMTLVFPTTLFYILFSEERCSS